MSVRAMKAGAIEFLPSRFADGTFSTPFDTLSIAIAPLERSGTSWLSFVAGTTP
jgi:hypothetical protein